MPETKQRPRSRYCNGDSIDLLCGCNSCSPSRVDGVICHEAGCPDAWKDNPKECSNCDRNYYAERRGLFGMCPRCSRFHFRA
jgi:hypothetical protein